MMDVPGNSTPLKGVSQNLENCAVKKTGFVKALSIRQPWAWLITHGFKDVENRDWWTDYRGELLIHAAKKMTRADYDACWLFLRATLAVEDVVELRGQMPSFEDMRDCYCGGIVGWATLTDCVAESASPWFTGRYGFVLRDAMDWVLEPYSGQLGLFGVPRVKAEDLMEANAGGVL